MPRCPTAAQHALLLLDAAANTRCNNLVKQTTPTLQCGSDCKQASGVDVPSARSAAPLPATCWGWTPRWQARCGPLRARPGRAVRRAASAASAHDLARRPSLACCYHILLSLAGWGASSAHAHSLSDALACWSARTAPLCALFPSGRHRSLKRAFTGSALAAWQALSRAHRLLVNGIVRFQSSATTCS